jgi:type II secretory pathway pseudopilin PulG
VDRARRRRSRERGITYVEVLSTVVILSILAMAVVPTAKAGRKKVKEMELRRATREIHDCIDQFRFRTMASMGGPVPGDGKALPPHDPPYPERLEELVEGPNLVNPAGGGGNPQPYRCLRAIPIDPITDTREWRLHCTDQHEADDRCSAGAGIWKVTTKSSNLSTDGKTRYNDPKNW